MKLFSLKKTLLGTLVSSFLLLGAVGASAQGYYYDNDYDEEYREWQEAQRRAQEEYRDYLRSRSRDDYQDWQEAQRTAQREYAEYRRSAGYNNRYTNRAGGSRWYRVYRDGRSYQMDNRGVEVLRRAVNLGYQQGYREGQMDARYGRNRGYYGSNVYRQGEYGYSGYVDQDQYQYYFQQGFQRGYQDGINNQSRFGYRTNNGMNILSGILNSILNLAVVNR